jgi:Ca2+-binding RTX toxin-like protein
VGDAAGEHARDGEFARRPARRTPRVDVVVADAGVDVVVADAGVDVVVADAGVDVVVADAGADVVVADAGADDAQSEATSRSLSSGIRRVTFAWYSR